MDHLEVIRDSIQAAREEPLHDWVVVAIWDHGGGGVTVYGESSPLQLKGYLHSGVWTLAHREPDGHERERMDAVSDVRSFPRGRMDVVRLAGSTIGRGTFDPGWRWSESVGPIVGTDLCDLPHIGYVISGRMMILPKEGEGYEICAGDAINIPPGTTPGPWAMSLAGCWRSCPRNVTARAPHRCTSNRGARFPTAVLKVNGDPGSGRFNRLTSDLVARPEVGGELPQWEVRLRAVGSMEDGPSRVAIVSSRSCLLIVGGMPQPLYRTTG
jgi:hypothetical protein